MPIITDGSENFSSVEEEKRVSYDSDEDFLQIMNKVDHLESVKVEMTEVRKENKRLKITLARMMEDYKSLETHLYDIKEQEDKGKNAKTYLKELETQQDDMLSLSLGTCVPNKSRKKEDESNYISNKEDKQMKSALSLGLECNFEDNQIPEEPSSNVSQENSSEAVEEYTPDNHSKTTGNEDDEVSQLIRLKKARVSVRARCEAPTMNDGCQWRKYGQKIAKGNPRPRAYYRCTLAPSCPVKKQVQRCAEDMSILITTYEGTHNHSLPASATAMASATSEAASMLVSGSSTSLSSTFGSSSSISSSLHGMKFNLFDDSRLRKIYLSNSCFPSSPCHPTITLDLTSSISTSPFNCFSSPLTSIFSCNGSSTSSNSSPSISNPLQTLSWSKNDYLNKADLNLYSKNASAATFDLDMIQSQSQDFFRRPLIQKGIHGSQSISLLNENIAAATKVITSDPSFQSILAAAISSVMGKGNEVHGRNQTLPVIGSVDQKPKWGDTISSHLSSNGVGCVSASTTLLNQQIEPNTTHGNLSFSLPPLSFSPYKKTPGASALYNRDQAK